MIGGLHNLDRLVVFVNVVDKQSVTQAAEDLYLTQPCISKHIKALEELFGVTLLERGRRRIVPTEAGWIVYRFAQNIIHSLEDLDNAMSEFRGAKVGNLYIGASSTIGNYLLPPILSRFKSQNPGADIILRIGTSQQVYEAVENGDIQIGLTTGIHIPEDLAVEVLCRDELVVVAARNHPLSEQDTITVQQLAEQDFIHSPYGTPTCDLIIETLNRVGIKPRIVIALEHPEAIKRAVEEHMGVSLLYRISVARELASGTLRELKVQGLSFWGDYNIIYNPSRYQSPILRRFLDFLRKEIVNFMPSESTCES